MPPLNPDHIKSVITIINQAPFFKHMAMQVTRLEMGLSEVILWIDRAHMNPFGGLHGGVFSSVIDTAAYWSAYCDLQEDQGLITIDLKVDLLAPASDGRVIVTGKRLKAGKTLCLTEARMANENGKVLAHGTSKLMVTRHKQAIHEAVDYICADTLPPKFLNLPAP